MEGPFNSLLKLNLFLCRHFETNSPLELRRVLGSALAMMSFSVRQRSHLLVPVLYGELVAAIDHDMLYSLFLFLSSQMCSASSVSVFFSSFSKELLWLCRINGPHSPKGNMFGWGPS